MQFSSATRNIWSLIALITMSILCGSCDPEGKQLEDDIDGIKQYLDRKGLVAQELDSGLHYIIVEEGEGEHPTLSSEVEVTYRGYTTTNTTFDETAEGDTVSFPLFSVIEGWQVGIPLFKKGGSGTLLIPSGMAYGENPPPGSIIGQDEILLFDIELIDFQ